VVVLVWAWRSHTPWPELGLARPRSWLRVVAVGLGFGIVFKLAMKTLVMPLLGAPDTNPAYHFLIGNAPALPGLILEMLVVAGFGEELLFRGFLFERLGLRLGRGTAARLAIVAITAMLFGIIHYPEQGWAGVAQAVVVGVVFGGIYSLTRSLWMLMIAHAAFDLTALWIIYWNLEAKFAHLVVR